MKKLNRKIYLNRLVSKKDNGLIKIVTGIRRCGKSYLLDPLFTDYLKENGVKNNHIIKIELDTPSNKKFWDAAVLEEYIKSLIIDDEMFYIILDEIQNVKDFELLLNSLLYKKNLDVYVTGSNSKFLSSDLITEFRGRGDQIRVYPYSFSEFVEYTELEKNLAWTEYITYGGMPLSVSMKNYDEKAIYLKDLFNYSYTKDIIERNNIKRVDVLNDLINMLASSVGSLTNPSKLFKTFVSKGEKELSINTIDSYIRSIEDSFIVSKANRYDVKGKKYIKTPLKYYFTDIGLRNARLNFRQHEENHIMENIIYNELVIRGYNVDVGVVEKRNANEKKTLEIDFICNFGSKRYYIQSALNIDSEEKINQESNSLVEVNDNFKKIIIVNNNVIPWRTNNGILVISIMDFLLKDNMLDI